MTLPVPLNAAIFVWDPAQDQTGSGGAGTWDLTSPRWLGGGTDNLWTNAGGDTAAFQGTGGLITLAAGITADGLSFDAPGYTLVSNGTAQVLTLGAGGIVVGASSGTITIGDGNLSLALGASGSFTNNSSGLLSMTGSISNGGNLLTLSNTSSGGMMLSGGISGTGGLTVNSSGAGLVTLSGSNSYTGDTSILAGTLKAGSAYALSSGSALSLANVAGATLDLNGFNQSVGSLSGGGDLGGNVVLGSGAVLTLGGALTSVVGGYSVNTNIANSSSWNTFAGLLSGSGSIAITGGGVVYLTNNNNSYTGFTNVLGGTLVVSNMGQLGASTTTINVAGVNSSLAGGALVVQGGTTGINFTRNLGVSGYGISGANNSAGYALVNIGNNNYSGIFTSAANSETRVGSVAGTMTFTSASTVNVAGGVHLMVNGYGNFLFNGFVTGGAVSTLSFYRWSGGGLLGQVTLANPYNNFLGAVDVTGSFLRVYSPGALGAAVDIRSIQSYAGTYELRVDPGNTDFSKKTIAYINASGSAIYAGRAAGGVGINQTVTFGGASVNGVISPGLNEALTSASALVTTFNGNDGYGVTIGSGGTVAYGFSATLGNNHSYTSNLNGLLTLNTSFLSQDSTATRTYTITANGDVLLTGNLLSSVGNVDQIWTKAGFGALAIQGTASTNVGVFNITNGSVYVNALSALNVNTTTGTGSGGLQIGSTTTNGILNYLGSAAGGVGETSSKAVLLSGTTGGAVLFANQQQAAANTGATALVLTSNIAAPGAGAKTLYLEGYNNTVNTPAVINQITGVILDNGTLAANRTSLLKGGSGTWLYAPAASAYAAAAVAAGATVSTNSTTTSGGKVLNFASTTGLAVGQQVFGTGIAAGSYISALTSTTVTLNVGTSAGISSGASIVFGGEASSATTLSTISTSGATVSGTTTVALASTAGLNVGMVVTAAAGLPAGASITAINSATNTITLSAATTAAISSSTALTFNGAANTNVVTLTNASGLVVGQSVTGTNVPAGTIITAIYGNNVVLNNTIATAIGAGSTLYFGSVGAAGVAQSFSGAVTVAGGTLQVQPTAASGSGSAPLTSSNNLVFSTDVLTGNGYAGGTFQMLGSADAGTTAMTVGQLIPTAGQGNILTTANGGTPTLTFGNATPIGTRGAGAVLNFSPGSGSTIQFTTSPTLVNGIIGLSTNNGFAYYTNPTTSAVDFATVTGTGPYVVSAYAGYVSGLPTSLSTATSTYWLSSGSVTTTANEAINALKISGNNTSLTLGGVLTLGTAGSASGVLFDNSTGSATIGSSSAAFTLGGAGSEIIVYTGGSTNANTLTISAAISSGTGSLTKAGSGKLIISGANAFTGNVNIDAGTLQLSGATATLGAITTVGNITAVRQDAVLDLNAAGAGNTITIGALTGAGTITNSGGGSSTAATLNIGSYNVTTTASATFSGLLQDGDGVLNVTKNGSGTQYLNPLNGAAASTTPTGQTLGSIGYNTYSGVTTIAQGTLAVTLLADYGSASSIGTGSAQSNAASLVLGSSAGTAAGVLQYVGQNNSSFLSTIQAPSVQTNRLFTLAGNGTLDSTGGYGNSAVGSGTGNNAAIWFTNTGSIAFSTSGAKTLTLQGSSTGDNEIDLNLIDNTIDSTALRVTKAGTGLWILGNAANTYSGATTISAGTLRAQDAGSTLTTATTVANAIASTVLDLANTAGLAVGQTVTGAGIAPGTTIASILGPLQIRLSTANTVASGTALTFGNVGSLSANSNLVLAGGVLETSGTFTRGLGTGAGQVQWLSGSSNGGFAASGSPLVVAIGGLTTLSTLTFGSSSFTNGTLLLGSTTALSDTTILNPIDLNGGARTITVTDNATTAADIYTLAGNISGASGSSLTLSTPASTMLLINGANTYTGNTFISGGGAFAVQSIGAGGASSSFGDATGTLNLGNGTTTGGYLLYVGTGETVTRTINLNTTTGTNTIDSSGSGALNITKVVNLISGTKTLTLTGESRDANTITSVLADNGGALAVGKGNGGVWILNAANTFTGGVTATDGFLGIGPGWSTISATTANPLGMSTGTLLTLGATGGMFTLTAGGTTIASTVSLTGTSGINFTFNGLNSIAFTGSTIINLGAAGSIFNNIAPSGTLTFGGPFSVTASAALTLGGTGNTIFNAGLPSTYTSLLTLNTLGNVTLNATNAHTGGVSLTQGNVVVNAKNPFGAAAGTFTFGGGTLSAGSLALTGANAILNPVSVTTSATVLSGSNSIEFAGVLGLGASRLMTNNIASGSSLIFSGGITNTVASTLTLAGSGNVLISGAYNAGTGANALAYSGTGTLTLTANNLYTGATTLNGGTTVISGAAGALSGTSAITVNPSATLTLDNSGPALANRLANRALTLAGGTLNFIGNSAGSIEGTAGTGAGALIMGASGQSAINITSNGGTTKLNFSSLTASAGSTLDVTSNVALGTSTNQVNFGSLLNTSAAAVTGTTLSFASTTGLVAGQAVTGVGILNGTTISSLTSTTVTLSQAVAASGVASGSAITFGVPSYGAITTSANSLLPRITIGGTSWAAMGANGLTTFTNYSTPSDVTLASLIATPTITLQVTGATTNALYSAGVAPGGRVLNALSINGSGLTVGVGNDAATGLASDLSLTLSSGGILVNGGTNTLNATRLVLAPVNVTTATNPSTTGTEAIIQVASGSTLNLGGTLVGTLMTNQNLAGSNFFQNTASPVASVATGGLTKGLSGNLNITARQFYTGATILNGGTTKLSAGNNTLFDNGGALTVNYGATLDLNGTVQYVGNFTSNGGAVPGAGGTVNSSNGASLLVTNATTSIWAGSITGSMANAITFARVNGGTTTMLSANSYYGATIILGGGITLQDNATLANTSSITLNYANLSLNNNTGLFINNNDRVNDAASISMNGGNLFLTGRANTYTAENLGALTAASGVNTITVAIGGTGAYTNADLGFASITRTSNAILNFIGSTLGADGSNPRILVTDSASLGYSAATGVIGAWAIANSDTWAGFNPSMGIGAVGTVGYQGYAGGYMSGGTVTTTTAVLGANVLNTYSGGTLNGFGAGNVTNILNGIAGINQVITMNAGGATTDYLRFAGATENDLAFTSSGDVLNIIMGGLLHSNSGVGSTMIGTPDVRGFLTTGGTATSGITPLVVYNTTNAVTGTGIAATGTVAGSNVVTVTSTTGLFAGMALSGTGIPNGSYITQVLSGTQLSINYNALSTIGGQTLTFVSDMVIHSIIQDNGLGSVTRLNKAGTGTLTLTAANTYTGGTIINQGTVNLSAATAGTIVIPGGGLTLVGSTTGVTATTLNVGVSASGGNAVGIGGQIDSSNTLTIIGKSIVNLAGTQTLNSLVFNNNGGEAAPTVTTAATIPISVLNLTSLNPITASSSNPANVSIISVASLGLTAGTNTITVNPIQIAGSTVTQLTAALSISSPIVGIGTTGTGVGITKAGNGLLQLSGASTFDGGVNLAAGGIAIGGSSITAGLGGPVISGPLGTGTFTIGAGTYLTSTAATNVISNALVLGGNDLSYKGPNGLTLNGSLSLNSGNTTVNVDVPGSFLTLGGVITDNGGSGGGTSGIIKTGLGTLALTNNNTFGGSIIVNEGVMVLGGATGNAPQPLANANVTITSNGTLALENNGLSNSGLIVYQGLSITVNPNSNYANLFVSNASSIGVTVSGNGTGNAIKIPQLTMTGTQVLNLASANAYSIIFQNVTNTTGAPRFNVAAGTTAYVYGYTAGNKPVNIGLGSLYFPDIVTQGTTTTVATNPIELSSYNGSNYYPLLIQAPATAPSTTPTGYSAGGLNAAYSSLAAAQGALNVNVAGIGFSGSGTVSLMNDAGMNNRAASTTASNTNGITTLQGLLNINTAGTYTFRSASDDASVLYIDGQLLISDVGPHAGLTEATGNGQITLSSGYHTITYTAYNATNSGSYRLLYAGADTSGNGLGNTVAGATGGFQSISSSNLFYAAGAPTSTNSYNFAAIINNNYTLAAGASATIDTLASPLGAVIAPTTGTAMVLNNNSMLNIVNGTNGIYGAGWVGVDGAITIGNGVVVATTNTASQGAGTLNLIGTITHAGGGAANAMFKAGTGSLILGGSNSGFTGDLVIQSGFVQLNNAAALSTGTTASLGGTLIRNVNTSTTSLPAVAGGSTTLTLAGADTASTLSLQVGMSVSGAGIPIGTYITAISGTTVTLSQAATTSGSGTYYFNASGMLDLNGQSAVAGNVTINGAGALIPSASATPTAILAAGSSGALWNSSLSAASLSGTLTLGSSSTVGGNGDLTLNSIVGGSGITLTKQGTNTLMLNASNGTQVFNISVALGTLKLGNAGALGAASNTLTIASGAVLDLNGIAVTNANALTITGVGYGGSGTITGTGTVSSLGALINTATTAASYAGTVTLGAAASIGTNYINTNSGLGSTTFGDLTLGAQVTGSAVLTKVGANTLRLTGITSASTLTGLTVAMGKVVISGTSTTVLGASTVVNVNAGAVSGLNPTNTLQLDYTGLGSTSVNRANGRAITLNGGTLLLTANVGSITAQNEVLGASSLTINGGFSVITLDANSTSTLALSTTGAGTIARTANTGTVLIRGFGLGQSAALTVGKTNVVLGTAPTPIGQTGAAGAKNAAIIPWIIVDDTGIAGAGTSFAFNGTNGLRVLAAGEMDTTFTANNNILLNSTTALSAGAAIAAYAGTTATAYTSTVINSLTFSTAVNPTLTINAGRNIGLDSGGILATVSATIGAVGGGFINASGSSSREMLIYTAGSSTVLTINAAVGGIIVPSPNGLTKSGEGTVILGAAQNSYTGQTRINLGTLKLAPATSTSNALFYVFTTAPTISTLTSTLNASALTVNAGGTFDLNGNSQTTGNFTSVGVLPGTGGTVTNSSTTASTLTVASSAAADWAGQITGDATHVINFVKTGAFTLSMHDNNSYAGSTTVQGNVLSLIDQGRLSGTSGIFVRNAVLQWNDTGIQAMSNRLASNVPLTLDGGAFQFISRSGTAGYASIGDLTLSGAANELRLDVGASAGAGTGIGTATLNITGTLSRSLGATLNFYAGTGTMGDNPSILFTSAPTLSNGIIGGWATVIGLDSTVASTTANAEFATYDPVTGVRGLTAAMQTTSFATSTSTSNLRFGDTAITVPIGGAIVNTLTWNGISAARALSFSAGTDTLTLTSGGLLVGTNNAATSIGSTSVRGQLTAGADQSELFLHVGANVLTVNSAIIDNGVSGGLNLVMDGMSQTTSTPTVTLAGANTYLGTTYANGVVVNLNNLTGAGNAISGNLIISGGNNNGTDSMPIANSQVVNLASQQVEDAATVTVRGGAQWTLNGFNETISSLVFNSQGGGTAGNGPIVQTGAGTLTLTGGITSTNLDDVRTVPALLGLLSLSSSTTITVDPVTNASVNGNGQIGLAINSNIVSSGSITKAGNGVLQLGGVSYTTNAVGFANGTSGTIVLGTNSNYASTTINLGFSGNVLAMRGQSNLQVGTITGVAGSIIKNFNVSTAGTLFTGDSVGGTFAGTFNSDYYSTGSTGGVLNVTKIGSGNWVLTGDSSAKVIGTLLVDAGTVTLSGATGKIGFAVETLSQGGVLTLDNSGVIGNAVSNRLGGSVAISNITRIMNFQGGTLNYLGNNNAAVSETLGTLTMLAGQSTFNLTASTGAFGTTVTLGTFTAQSATNTGTLLISTAGLLGGGAAGSGRVNVTATTAGLVGSIRPDIIGTDSTGTGLVTSDANGFRLLKASDTALGYLAPTGSYLGAAAPVSILALGGVVSNVAASSNVFVSKNLSLYASTTINSLTLNSGGGVTSTGGGASVNYLTGLGLGSTLFNAAGTVNTLTVTSGAVVATTGNAGITGGAITQGAAGLIFHTLDTLNVNAYLIGTGVLVKADSGTLNLQKFSYITGATFVNAGELDLSAGANTLLAIPTSTALTLAALNINGGTVDLKGNNQAVGSLTQTNGNILPGGAGTVTNTGAAATLFTNPSTATTTFVGTIAGNIILDKSGANNLVLNNADGRNANMITNIRGGTLTLKDSGTIANGGTINNYFSTLTLDNSGLSALAARTGASAINLIGGTLVFGGRQGTDALTIAGGVNLLSGASTITENLFGSSAVGTGAAVLTLASLNQSGTATLNFTVGGGTLGAAVLGMNGLAPGSAASNPQILITAAPTLVNGIIGGWAVVGGTDFASYRATMDPVTGALGVGALGLSLNSTTPFGAYSASALTVGSAIDNITISASVGAVTSRAINSLRISAVSTATLNTLGDVLSITSGGLLTNGALSVIAGGRLTAGAATSSASSLYVYANNTATINSTITNNSNGNLLSLVKTGTSTTTLNVLPTVWTTATTTASNIVTVNSTAGLAVGQTVSAALGQTAGAMIIGITDATRYTLSANVGTGSATAAGTQFGLPTSQVLTIASASFTSNTITVPAGSVIYPGMSVSLAAAAAGGGVITASATVASVSGNTVTLNGAFTTLPTGPATVLFGSIAASTATTAAASTTSGSNVVTLASSTSGLYIGEVLSGNANIPGGATITAITSPTTFTISAPASGTGTSVATTITTTATAPAAQSLVTTTTSGSSSVTILGTPVLFTGQAVQGNGIPQGTTITGITQGTGVTFVTLSQNATVTGTANQYYGLQPVGLVVAGSTLGSSFTVTVASTAGLVTGQSVNGAGIPVGATISSITDATHFVLSLPALMSTTSAPLTIGAALNPTSGTITGVAASTTAGSATVTVASTAGLYVGMPVTGNPNIPANEFITAITSATTFTITTGTGVTAGTNVASTIGSPAIGGYSNSYSGPTVVNQGTLTLSGTLGGIQVPGDLIINNANVTETTNAGQIASTSNVTFNGNAGVLTLVNANTFATLTFNGTGGAQATTNITGGTFVLSGTTNAITAVNDSVGSTPTISSATIWELAGANRTITTSGLSPIDLILSGVIQNVMGGTLNPAGLIKMGSGSLVLSGANTFNGGVQLNEGTLILGSSSSPSGVGVALVPGNTGPLGIGTLTIAGGTTLMSGSAIQTVSNNVVVNGDFALGGPVAANGVILNGTVDLGSDTRTITVTSPQNVSTLGGAVSGTAGLAKAGNGVLKLGSTANAYGGSTTILGGLLQLGAAGVIPDGSALIVAAGAAFDLNGKNETLGSLAGDTATTGGMITNSVTGTSATLTIGADNTSTTYAGILTDTKAGVASTGNLLLVKTGTGVQTLTGANTYAGATLVTGGNLQVGSGGVGSVSFSAATVSGTGTTTTVSGVSGTPATTSTVSANQLAAPTLSGTGTVGAVILGSLSTVGVLRPGDAAGSTPGTLTLTGALTVNSGSQIQFGVTSSNTNAISLDSGWSSDVTAASYLGTHATAGAGSTPDSIYSQWNTVSGTYSSLSLAGKTVSLGASAGGTPTVLIQTAGDATLAFGDIFKLMDWASVGSGIAGSIGTPSGSSAFDTANDLVLPELSSGLFWDTSAFASYGIVVIVPEPGRMVLMLFGLAALFLRRRRTQAGTVG
ncbi:autotransporter-associated beta strand repeat-containing protein [Prosthecobacter sp.]|uniref:autotransporter-associated beta strand repeat-containing protein n=1 Tax=Prosthecobacter sp. TaxID=1965333 RepID=UPI003782E462